jgi:NTP pyrophosphatase (non-canonical NTP hydrolase)
MKTDIKTRVDNALDEVGKELARALGLHPQRANSPHEGYAVILEELDELWDEVKKKRGGRDNAARKEAIQVAAMALRYVIELCD